MLYPSFEVAHLADINRQAAASNFTPRLNSRPSPHVAEAVYDALMGTLNPTLSLTNQEVQLELNRIAEQSKAKLTVKPAEVGGFRPRQASGQRSNSLTSGPRSSLYNSRRHSVRKSPLPLFGKEG